MKNHICSESKVRTEKKNESVLGDRTYDMVDIRLYYWVYTTFKVIHVRIHRNVLIH